MFNKKVVVSLAAMVILGGTGVTSASAAEGDTQTIDNSTGVEMRESAEIKTEGLIGIGDNTDPEELFPEGDKHWINVTIPTSVVFNSDVEKQHKEITAPTYKIKNNSGRPVKVTLKEFIGSKESDSLKTLNLTAVGAGFEEKELVKNGIVTATESELVKLANKEGDIGGGTGATEVGFTFTGTVEPKEVEVGQKETPEKEKVSYNLGLKFKALKMDGTEVAN